MINTLYAIDSLAMASLIAGIIQTVQNITRNNIEENERRGILNVIFFVILGAILEY